MGIRRRHRCGTHDKQGNSFQRIISSSGHHTMSRGAHLFRGFFLLFSALVLLSCLCLFIFVCMLLCLYCSSSLSLLPLFSFSALLLVVSRPCLPITLASSSHSLASLVPLPGPLFLTLAPPLHQPVGTSCAVPCRTAWCAWSNIHCHWTRCPPCRAGK